MPLEKEYHIPAFRSNLTERWVKNTISYDELLEKSAVMGIDLDGRKGNYNAAIDDINKVRARAAFKAGETRAEVLARDVYKRQILHWLF